MINKEHQNKQDENNDWTPCYGFGLSFDVRFFSLALMVVALGIIAFFLPTGHSTIKDLIFISVPVLLVILGISILRFDYINKFMWKIHMFSKGADLIRDRRWLGWELICIEVIWLAVFTYVMWPLI